MNSSNLIGFFKSDIQSVGYHPARWLRNAIPDEQPDVPGSQKCFRERLGGQGAHFSTDKRREMASKLSRNVISESFSHKLDYRRAPKSRVTTYNLEIARLHDGE